MPNREELDRLIEAAFADKELTPKEMGILIQKAKELGINEDEFIIELDARMHKLKKKKDRKPRSTSPNSSKRFISKKVIILIIICSAIVIGLLLVNEFKPTRYKSETQVESEFYKAIEGRKFDKAYELLNELKVLTDSWDHFDYHKKLLDIRIPYLLENNAWEVAFSELKELSGLAGTSEEHYYQEMLFIIADNVIKNQSFNNVTQILDYFFIWVSDEDFDEEGFLDFMKSSLSYLISKSQYLDALSLIKYYPISNYDINAEYYMHDSYNEEAIIINEALERLLGMLLINNVRNFPYSELVNMYKPIIKRGEFYGTSKVTKQRIKQGKPNVWLGENLEYYQVTINLYKFYPTNEYKLNAQQRLKEAGIFR